MGLLDRDYMRRDYVPRAAKKITSLPKNGGMPYWPFFAGALLLIALGLYLTVLHSRQMPVATRSSPHSEQSPAPTAGGLPDINKASREQIRSLPLMTDSLTDELLQKRPFQSWDDVDTIYGIGPKRLEKLREHFIIGNEATSGSGVVN